MGAATGSMTVFGSNQTTNATAFNIFEVSAWVMSLMKFGN
jgi:hypothetical protein